MKDYEVKRSDYIYEDIDVLDHVGNVDYSVDEFCNILKSLRNYLIAAGNVDIKLATEYNYDGNTLKMFYYRPPTDIEIKKILKDREKTKKIKEETEAKKRERELKQYEKLKAKYEGKV